MASFPPPAFPAMPPIDLSRIVPAAGRDRCAPVQVAPSVWIAPDCSAAMSQRLASSPFVTQRSFDLKSQGALPPAVDLRVIGLDGPVKDQQMVGICWAFATSTVMDNAIRRAGRPDVIAPLHVLSSHVWEDIWSRGRSERAITREPSWPYDPIKGCKLNESPSEIWCEQAYHVRHGSWRSDPALVGEVERANQTGAYAISRVQTLPVHPVNPDQLAAILAKGQSIWVAFDYNRAAWGDSGHSGAVLPDWDRGEGGHAVALVGYRATESGRQFLMHNSWGTEWRDHGYAWVSEGMVRRHVFDAFTLEVSPRSGSQLPSLDQLPIPLPKPAGECPDGQVRDSVLHLCAPRCPNGGAPAAMVCSSGGACPSGLPPLAGFCAPTG